MYYPFFRGKQYELIAIRETALVLAASGFVPIIEPVRTQMSGLHKSLEAVCEADAEAIVIVNPQYGHMSDDLNALNEWLEELNQAYADLANVGVGILLNEQMTTERAVTLCNQFSDRNVTMIHSGFQDANGLAAHLPRLPNVDESVFLEDQCGKLYQRHFRSHRSRVLVRDGFQRQRGRDYPDTEFFSDLHITYIDENVTGFGDFLTVGDEYSEGGGPAYTVVIHITYIDADQDEAMYVKHFKSDSQETAQDPGGKFAEALVKLMDELDNGPGHIIETSAIGEFRDLQRRGHYPGLGYVKKLSMKHHIETMAEYLGREAGGD